MLNRFPRWSLRESEQQKKQGPRHLFVASHTSELGGPNLSLLTVLRYLDPELFRISILLPDEGEACAEFRSAGVHVLTLDTRAGYSASSIPRIRQMIVRNEADLVYGNNFSGAIRNVCLAARLARQPFIWHVREILKPDCAVRNWFPLRLADSIVAVSEASSRSLRQFVPSSRTIHVIHNAVDLEHFSNSMSLRSRAKAKLCTEFGIAPDHRVVLTLGDFCERKGQDYLIEVASLVISRRPCTTFLAVGRANDVHLVGRLKAMCAELSLENHVRFGEFTPDVSSLLRGADLLAHPARWEPFGRVIIEAMAAELPVVAFRLDGPREIVRDGRTGFLIEPFDIQAFAGKILDLLQDNQLTRRMGTLARQDVGQRFSPSHSARQLGEVLSQVAFSRGKRHPTATG